jgi:hypothetical protein
LEDLSVVVVIWDQRLWDVVLVASEVLLADHFEVPLPGLVD